MRKRALYRCITISIFLLICVFLVVKNTGCERNKPITQEFSKKDMIIVYKKGMDIKVLPDSEYFKELKDEIENFSANINDTYRVIPSEERFNKLKKKGSAVELIYAFPEELKVDFLPNPIRVSRIIIPLAGSDFPQASVFVYEDQKKIPHVFANTRQSKDRLLELIKPIK